MRQIVFAALAILVIASPAFALAPWVHNDWEFRVPFSAVPTQIEGTETFVDFGMLVILDGTRHGDVFASAKTDGSDLLFTTQTGAAILEREIVSYDHLAQTAEIWVRVPGFSEATNEFFLYYDNPAANLDPAPAGTWGPEYRAVYHFADDPAGGVLTDASPQASDATLQIAANWMSSDVENGAVGQGWFFNGSTHHIATKSISTADSSYAISAWLKHTNQGSTDFFFHAQPGFWHLAKYTSDNAAYAAAGQSALRWNPTPIVYDNDYHHFLWMFDAVDDTVTFYYDGDPSPVWGNFPPDPPWYTGRLINPTQSDWVGVVGPMFAAVVEDYHDGGADEFRIREGVVGPDRILTEFRNSDDNVAFFQFEPTESRSMTAVADGLAGTSRLWLRGSPNPSQGRSSVSYFLPRDGSVRLGVYDVAGRRIASLVDRKMQAGSWVATWNGRGPGGEPVAAGVYFLRLETPYGTTSTKLTLVR